MRRKQLAGLVITVLVVTSLVACSDYDDDTPSEDNYGAADDVSDIGPPAS